MDYMETRVLAVLAYFLFNFARQDSRSGKRVYWHLPVGSASLRRGGI